MDAAPFLAEIGRDLNRVHLEAVLIGNAGVLGLPVRSPSQGRVPRRRAACRRALGRDAALITARYMEYRWTPETVAQEGKPQREW